MRLHADPAELLHLLADGRFHSGQSLALALGIGRGAVWKRIRRLQDTYNVQIDAVRGRGYRARPALDLLSSTAINAALAPQTRQQIESLECVISTASTNSLASESPPRRSNMARVWFAEHQSAARGRRGRQWICSFAGNLYLSLAWRFDRPMSELASLSLVAGIAVCEGLAESGVEGHGLKWPNDIMHDCRKLAGILLEVSGESTGPATAVIGIGINLNLPKDVAAAIDQPWTDLAAICLKPVLRNRLAATLTEALVAACAEFARDGLQVFARRWQHFDSLVDQQIQVHSATRTVEGRYAGISGHGALLMDNADGRSEHFAGEVSVRRVGGR